MYKIFFPRVENNSNKVGKVGAQVEGAVNTTWIVPNRPYQWNDCEPVKGTYEFPAYAMYNHSHLGSKQIVGTKTCPLWARLWVDKLCSPPKPECYVDYANWICEIIDTYHPWGIELWNEPDCRYEDSAPENFGCWWDGVSWYSSGKRYGQFTKTVYDIVKAHSPDTQMIVGSLMMVSENESYSFLQGAMAGGLTGDLLSYHGYITERSGFDRIFGLARSIKNICNYIPLACSETSVLSWTDSLEFQSLQRDYLQYLIDHVEASGIEHILIYTLSGNDWLNSDLIHDNQSTPAWELFRSYGV